jgi:hypothetical protein
LHSRGPARSARPRNTNTAAAAPGWPPPPGPRRPHAPGRARADGALNEPAPTPPYAITGILVAGRSAPHLPTAPYPPIRGPTRKNAQPSAPPPSRGAIQRPSHPPGRGPCTPALTPCCACAHQLHTALAKPAASRCSGAPTAPRRPRAAPPLRPGASPAAAGAGSGTPHPAPKQSKGLLSRTSKAALAPTQAAAMRPARQLRPDLVLRGRRPQGLEQSPPFHPCTAPTQLPMRTPLPGPRGCTERRARGPSARCPPGRAARTNPRARRTAPAAKAAAAPPPGAPHAPLPLLAAAAASRRGAAARRPRARSPPRAPALEGAVASYVHLSRCRVQTAPSVFSVTVNGSPGTRGALERGAGAAGRAGGRQGDRSCARQGPVLGAARPGGGGLPPGEPSRGSGRRAAAQ